MSNYFKKFRKILSVKQFNFFFFILILVLIGTFFEMLGVGVLFPLLNLLSEDNNAVVKKISLYLNFDSNNYNKQELITIFSIFILVVYFIKSIFLTLLAYIFANYIKNIKIYLTKILFNKYLSLKYISILKKNSNIAINTIIKEVDELASNFIVPLIILLNEIVVSIGLFILIIFLFPLTSLYLIFSLSIIGCLFIFFSSNFNSKWGMQRLKYSELSLKTLNQSLNAFKEIRLLSNKNIFVNSFTDFIDIKNSAQAKQSILDQSPRFWLEFLLLFLIFLYSFYFITIENDFSNFIPLIGILAVAGFRILPSLNRIVNTIQIIRYGKASIDKIYEELNFLELNEEKFTNNKFEEDLKFISINNLNYKFDNQKSKILDNINLRIKKNDCIGIIGKSGSGKTTLVNLISGLIHTENDRIYINNSDINNIRSQWQKKIGYVSQHTYVFDDNLRSNISLEIEENKISNKQVEKAIHLAQLDDLEKKLHKNLEANIGEKGNKLSGGQIQRIGIARALYQDPELLILDEPSSALDTKTEIDFFETLNKFKNNYTTIIISHSKNAIKYCDAVYEIIDGKLIKIEL